MKNTILCMVVASVVAGFLFISCSGRQRQASLETSFPAEATVVETAVPTNAASGENLFPDPGFEQPDSKAWSEAPGLVFRDKTAAAIGQYSYCLKVAPNSIVHLDQISLIPIQPWTWYELSYSYRIDPPVRFFFGLRLNGQNRSRQMYSRDHLKPGQFVQASFKFLSYPTNSLFGIYVYAASDSKEFLPGTLWIDDLSLKSIGPAGMAERKNIKLVDGSFESPIFVSGYDHGQKYVTIETSDAKDGKRILKPEKGQGKGSFSIDISRPDGAVQVGHLYRASIWARGQGRCAIALTSERSNPTQLDSREWREIAHEYLVDDPPLGNVKSIVIHYEGDLEFDAAGFVRIQ